MSTVPTLAGRTGRYVESRPVVALRRHFRCAWSHQLADDLVAEVVVVPDGCVDLVWRDGRLMAVGPDLVAAHPQLKAGETIIGLRFQPGAAAGWLGLPMDKITGLEVELRDLWGPGVQPAIDRLLAAPPSDRSLLLQALMVDLVPRMPDPAPDGLLMFRALQQPSGDEAAALPALSDRLGTSERTLRRRSHHLFGYGPKTLGRILRFQRFGRLAGSTGHSGLADLAAAAGYADQAHLSREVRSLCSMSASQYLRQLQARPAA